MSDFEIHFLCDGEGCDHWFHPLSGDMRYHYEECCPKCGQEGIRHYYNRNTTKVVRRWVSTSVWYKPWTRDSGYWEYREGYKPKESE